MWDLPSLNIYRPIPEMKRTPEVIFFLPLFLAIGFLLRPFVLSAQQPVDPLHKTERLQVAIFAPLYLDSAFDAQGNYRYNKTIPPFLATGLDYYFGLQQAIDSLTLKKAAVDIHIFDSRDPKQKPEALIGGDTLKKMHLIAGFVNVNEASVLGRFAKSNQIPFININLPNEAGSIVNPYQVVINPTLATHCSAIYKYLQRSHALSRVILITKKGTQEERIKTYLDEAANTTASVPIKIHTLEIKDTLDQEALLPLLDSNKNTVCIIGSLDLQFGTAVCTKLAQLSMAYPLLALGMPTWDQMNFTKPALKGLEMAYSTSFHAETEQKEIKDLRQALFSRYYVRVKDITLRGYDILCTLCQLPPAPGPSLLEQIYKTRQTLIGQLMVQPMLNPKTGIADYSENKYLLFVKKLNGTTVSTE